MVAVLVRIREWNELKNLGNGFKYLSFSYNATVITFKRFACIFYNSYNEIARRNRTILV